MRHLGRALAAEVLKLKRTLSVLIVFAAPALVSLVYCLILFTQARDTVIEKPWLSLFGSSGTVWVLVMLPLVVVTVTALWAAFEHDGGAWTHLFALAVSRPAVFAAKWLLSQGLVALSTFMLAVSSMVAGAAVGLLLLPHLTFTWPPPVGYMLGHAAVLTVAAVFMVTIHTWVSLRFSRLYVAFGFGVACPIGSLFASFSDTWNRLLPWTLPLRVHAVIGANVPATLACSLVGGLIVGAAALCDLSRHDYC